MWSGAFKAPRAPPPPPPPPPHPPPPPLPPAAPVHASLLPGSRARQPPQGTPQGTPLRPVQDAALQFAQSTPPWPPAQSMAAQPAQSVAVQPSLAATVPHQGQYKDTLPLNPQLQPVPCSRPATWRHLSCWTDAQSNFASDAGFVALAEAQRRDGGCFRLLSSAHAGYPNTSPSPSPNPSPNSNPNPNPNPNPTNLPRSRTRAAAAY